MEQEFCGGLKDLGVAQDAAVAQAFGFDVAAVLDVMSHQAPELDRGVLVVEVVEDQGRDGVGFGEGWGAVVVEVIAVDAFDVIYQALLDLGVEAHDVAEQVCHLGDEPWRGVEDLLGDRGSVFLSGK